MSKSFQIEKHLIPGLLILLILVNLVVVVPEIGSFGVGILRNWDQPGLWRSARFAYSANFADYIQFLEKKYLRMVWSSYLLRTSAHGPWLTHRQCNFS